MLYDTATASTLPAKQLDAMFSGTVRDYLAEKCAKGADGKTPEFRIWDAAADASNESAVWQGALKRARKSLPWIVISNGKAGYEGPTPGTVEDMLTLLKKYGG